MSNTHLSATIPASTLEKPAWAFVLPWDSNAIGGVNQVVRQLCQQLLQRSDYRPLIICLDWQAETPVIDSSGAVTEIRIKLRSPQYQTGHRIKSRLTYALQRKQTLQTLRELIEQFNVRVINPHYVVKDYFAISDYCASQANAPRLIYSAHGSDIRQLKPGTDMRFWRAYFKPARALVVCANGLADVFRGKRPEINIPMLTVVNGIAAQFTDWSGDAESPLGISNYLLSVGSFDRVKGFDVLIAAFHRVVAQKPDLRLVIVGRTSDELEPLQAQSEALGISNKLHFVRDIDPQLLPGYYQHAQMFISSSREEAMPLVILEAGAMGLPVIASKTGGAREIIQHRSNGILVDIDAVDELAEEILNLCNDAVQRRLLGAKLKSQVIQQHSWTQAAQQYLALAEE